MPPTQYDSSHVAYQKETYESSTAKPSTSFEADDLIDDIFGPMSSDGETQYRHVCTASAKGMLNTHGRNGWFDKGVPTFNAGPQTMGSLITIFF